MGKSKIIVSILVCFLAASCSNSNSIDSTETVMEDSSESSDFLDVVWEMQEYTDANGSLANVSDDTKYQFMFESGGNAMQAFIGCVNFSESTYSVSDGYINFTLGASDSVVCINQTEPYLEQDRAIMRLINGGGPSGSVPLMHSLVDEKLQLQSADGRVLSFIQVSDLMLQE